MSTQWIFDPTHSELTFKVKHLMITNVKGAFNSFTATLEGGDDTLHGAVAGASIEVASINTNNTDRDNHLKSGDFFDAANYPTITFTSNPAGSFQGGHASLSGNLTIKGITKEITMQVAFGGISKDPWGNEKAGFSLSGAFNRTDFGLSWNAALETGGVLLSEEVKFEAEVQFVKKSA